MRLSYSTVFKFNDSTLKIMTIICKNVEVRFYTTI